MAYLLSNCVNLTQLDVSGFDTSNVTSMQQMFNGCRTLTTIPIENQFQYIKGN